MAEDFWDDYFTPPWPWSRKAANPLGRDNQPRDLTDDDRLAWDEALDQREKIPPQRTLDNVRDLIRNRNPIRWRRLRKDYEWVQKEMIRLGLNPEDARYLL